MPGRPSRHHELNFHFSTMAGGKTAEILLDEYRKRDSGWNTIIAKPEGDSKAGTRIQSRIAGGMEAPALLIPEKVGAGEFLRREIANRLGASAVWEHPWLIYVDEAQFLSPEQVKQLATGVVDADIATIEAYGLLNDFRGELFPGSAAFLKWADRKIQIASACERTGCGRVAAVNARLLNGIVTTEGPQKAIDGIDATYSALCRSHYLEETN